MRTIIESSDLLYAKTSSLKTNLAALFYERAAQYGDQPLFYHRAAAESETSGSKSKPNWHAWSWNEVAATATQLAQGLADHGVAAGDRVVIVAENRPQWAIADIAVLSLGAVTVPAYITHSQDDHAFIMKHCNATAVIVSTVALTKTVIKAAATSGVELVITMVPENAASQFQSLLDSKEVPQSLRLIHWDTLCQPTPQRFAQNSWLKKAHQLKLAIPTTAMAQIAYSSGTGGQPKGIMLSHHNILHNCFGAEAVVTPALRRGVSLEGWLGGVRRIVPNFILPDHPKIFLSFLPLSHSYEHTAGLWLPIMIGARVYYAESVERLAVNLIEVRPTIMTLVPRLFELLHGRIELSMSSASKLKKSLFAATIAEGKARYMARHGKGDLSLRHRLTRPILTLLVRRKVRHRFGGRIRALVSGGAALPLHLAEYFYFLGLPVCQGYGQTEASPVVSVNPPSKVRLDTVGPPLYGVEIKIANDGEILIRGDNVMIGYWQNPEATAAALVDGWLHSGDIGSLDADGYLRITDRKRDIIKLTGGDTLSPAKVEQRLLQEAEIAQVLVYGDGMKSLSALIFVSEAVNQQKLSNDSRTELVQKAIDRCNQNLSQPEKIKSFRLINEGFTIDNGLLTPTLKIKRHLVLKRYDTIA